MHTDSTSAADVPCLGHLTSPAQAPGQSGRRQAGPAARSDAADPAVIVTALYSAHALSLIRLAHIMLGNPESAQDVVQEAFFGLYRRWDHLADKDRALGFSQVTVRTTRRRALAALGRILKEAEQ